MKNKKNDSEFIELEYGKEKQWGDSFLYPAKTINIHATPATPVRDGKYVLIEYPPPFLSDRDPNKDRFLARCIRKIVDELAELGSNQELFDEYGWIKSWSREFIYEINAPDPNTIEGLESLLHPFGAYTKTTLEIIRLTASVNLDYLNEKYGLPFSEKLLIKSNQIRRSIYNNKERIEAYLLLAKMYKKGGDKKGIEHSINNMEEEFYQFIEDSARYGLEKIKTRKEWFGDGLMFPCAPMTVHYGVYRERFLENVKSFLGIIEKGLKEIGYEKSSIYSPENVEVYLDRAMNRLRTREFDYNFINNFF